MGSVVDQPQAESTASDSDGAGPGRPAFAAEYPASPELDELLAAFRAGNYQLVRQQATELARDTKDPHVRRAAQDLRQRLDPSRLSLYLFLLPVLLLLILVAHYLLGSH